MAKVDLTSLSTLPSIIELAIETKQKELHTAMPGIIEKFDPVQQLATVQPAIKRIFKTSDSEEQFLTPVALPLLINVPVVFPSGGGYHLTFPVQKGDECLLVFCERAIDVWHERGQVQEPNARRFHSLSDATCFVGLSSIPNKIPNFDATNAQLRNNDGSVSISLTPLGIVINGNVIINGTATVTGTMAMQGGATVDGSMENDGVDIGATHTHTQGNDSGGNIEQNTGVPV